MEPNQTKQIVQCNCAMQVGGIRIRIRIPKSEHDPRNSWAGQPLDHVALTNKRVD